MLQIHLCELSKRNFREVSETSKPRKIKLNDEHDQPTPDKLGKTSESEGLHCGNLFEFK